MKVSKKDIKDLNIVKKTPTKQSNLSNIKINKNDNSNNTKSAKSNNINILQNNLNELWDKYSSKPESQQFFSKTQIFNPNDFKMLIMQLDLKSKNNRIFSTTEIGKTMLKNTKFWILFIYQFILEKKHSFTEINEIFSSALEYEIDISQLFYFYLNVNKYFESVEIINLNSKAIHEKFVELYKVLRDSLNLQLNLTLNPNNKDNHNEFSFSEDSTTVTQEDLKGLKHGRELLKQINEEKDICGDNDDAYEDPGDGDGKVNRDYDYEFETPKVKERKDIYKQPILQEETVKTLDFYGEEDLNKDGKKDINKKDINKKDNISNSQIGDKINKLKEIYMQTEFSIGSHEFSITPKDKMNKELKDIDKKVIKEFVQVKNVDLNLNIDKVANKENNNLLNFNNISNKDIEEKLQKLKISHKLKTEYLEDDKNRVKRSNEKVTYENIDEYLEKLEIEESIHFQLPGHDNEAVEAVDGGKNSKLRSNFSKNNMMDSFQLQISNISFTNDENLLEENLKEMFTKHNNSPLDQYLLSNTEEDNQQNHNEDNDDDEDNDDKEDNNHQYDHEDYNENYQIENHSEEFIENQANEHTTPVYVLETFEIDYSNFEDEVSIADANYLTNDNFIILELSEQSKLRYKCNYVITPLRIFQNFQQREDAEKDLISIREQGIYEDFIYRPFNNYLINEIKTNIDLKKKIYLSKI